MQTTYVNTTTSLNRCKTSNSGDNVSEDDITLAETIVHDNENGSSCDNDKNNSNSVIGNVITIINNVDHDSKEEACFIREFIRDSIAQDMNDLALVYIILTKCRKSNLFTERENYYYTVQALLKAFTIINSTATQTQADTRDDVKHIRRQEEKDNFKTVVGIVMQEQKLFSSTYKDSDELMTFLQNNSDKQSNGREEEQKLAIYPSREELKNKVDRVEKCLNGTSNTFKMQAFCGIASLILNSIVSNHSGNNDSISIIAVLTEMITETAPLQSLPVHKISNFADEAQIRRAIETCISGCKEIVGDDGSIDYVNNLDLYWILAEDAASTMVNSILLKNRGSDNDVKIQNSISLVETVVKLQITMINVVLNQLEEQSKTINSIVKIMDEHPCVASIQEKGCEKLANFSSFDTISFDESQAAANVVVDAMIKHEDISNVQTFGKGALLSLRNAMVPNNPITNRITVDDETPQTTCFSRLLSKFCC